MVMQVPKIQVLLATYNGEPYLRALLDSVFAQDGVDVSLLVRDDGSSDATVSILHEYQMQCPGRMEMLPGYERLGPMLSFSVLMQAAKEDYVAFADQDDVWEHDKLATLMQRMSAVEKNYAGPCLVHCDLRVVDRSLVEMAPSFWRHSGLVARRNRFEDILFQNTVTGCAALCNRALLELAMPVPPEAIMHDHWLALCASAFGKIDVEPRALVQYRQHGLNSVGVRAGSLTVLFGRLLAVVSAGGWRMNWAQELRQPRAFMSLHGDRLSLVQAGVLRDLLAVERANAFMRRWLLLKHWMAPGGFLKKLVFWMRA